MKTKEIKEFLDSMLVGDVVTLMRLLDKSSIYLNKTYQCKHENHNICISSNICICKCHLEVDC